MYTPALLIHLRIQVIVLTDFGKTFLTLSHNRYFKHRHPSFLVNGLDDGNVCPACPKV